MSGWPTIRSGVSGHRDKLIESISRPQEAQSRLLQQILSRNCDSEFGQRMHFSDLSTVEEYQQRVPLQTYEDIRPDINRMLEGEANILCGEDILLFEQTGGSSGGEKFIPFTQSLLEGVRRAVLPWLDDLLESQPGIMAGRAYWAISPAMRKRRVSAGGTPIGIDNDALYFGNDLATAIVETLAVSPSVAGIESVDDWRMTTIEQLVACEDLSFVSVWSPTFFLQLLDAVPDGSEVNWPLLDTISCWCSATSRRYAAELAGRFPTVTLQGKGLLATEGVVTVPFGDAVAPVLAVESAVFEFVNKDGDVLLPWQLETGDSYSVVMTTEAGLYRYQLGDRVLVMGWLGESPCLEYVGREGGGSDLCGEKLTVEFVDSVLGETQGFAYLLPVAASQPHYCVILDANVVTDEQVNGILNFAEKQLAQNPQYKYAREMGQLSSLVAKRIQDPVGEYQRVRMEAGQRLGDIKPTSIASPVVT